MSNSIQDLFKERDYCCEELGRIRKTFGDKSTTRQMYDALERTLLFMLLYCPQDLYDIVHATINEAGVRRVYFETGIWCSQPH